jgi:hypothetical protein
MKFGIIVLKF